MATYLELHVIKFDSDLQDKVGVAVTKKAQALLDLTTPSSAQVAWASEALENPRSKGLSLLNYVLAKNSGLTKEQILSATDIDIQANINDAVDAIIAGVV